MKRALLVEDDVIVARLTRSLLTRMGWDADWVQTGREAIETLSSKRYRVVLLDLGLPDLDGAAVMVWLRHFERERGHARTPVVLATASEDPAILDLDVDEVLQKPVRMPALKEALRYLEEAHDCRAD